MNEKIKEQILEIRDTGFTNMLDTNTVQRLANDRGLYDLVKFIEEKKNEYVRFIFGGSDE